MGRKHGLAQQSTAMSFIESLNCMGSWAAKGNDLENGTYPDKADLSLAESRCKRGYFPNMCLWAVGKKNLSVGPPNKKFLHPDKPVC